MKEIILNPGKTLSAAITGGSHQLFDKLDIPITIAPAVPTHPDGLPEH